MRGRDFLERWGLTSLTFKLGFLEGEFSPNDPDRRAAWELYVELLTRITTQGLLPADGDEKTALDSIFSLFGTTRDILKRNGSGCVEFAKIAIPVLNQVIRPFTARWHRLALEGAFSLPAQRDAFRRELQALQPTLRNYTRALADLAQVEDLSDLEDE